MAANSFEAVALEWHAMKSKKWANVTAHKVLVHLRTYAFREIGRPSPASKVSALLDMLRKVQAKGVACTATRIREMCAQIFRYGVATEKQKITRRRILSELFPSPAPHTGPPLPSAANLASCCAIACGHPFRPDNVPCSLFRDVDDGEGARIPLRQGRGD